VSSILEKNAYDKTYSAISKTYGLANLLPFSFLIMGLPIDVIVSLFFYQSFTESFSLDLASLTLILLLVDILRMSVLTLLVPRLRKINVIRLEVYGAAVAIILCGIFFLWIGFTIAKNLFSVFDIVLESLILGINQTNLTLFILFVSLIIIGIVHVYYGWLIIKNRFKRPIHMRIAGFATLTLLLIIIRLVLPLVQNSDIPYQLTQFLQITFVQENEIASTISSIGIFIIVTYIVYLIIASDIQYRKRQLHFSQITLLKLYDYLHKLEKNYGLKYPGSEYPLNHLILKLKRWKYTINLTHWNVIIK
jgi:hypothetical protein